MELIIIETARDSIPTVYAYYTDHEKAARGKHCENWTPFGHSRETAPFKVGDERKFIEKIDAENPGVFRSYLISWAGCE